MAASCSASEEELQCEELLLWWIPRPWCISALLRMRVIAAVVDMEEVTTIIETLDSIEGVKPG